MSAYKEKMLIELEIATIVSEIKETECYLANLNENLTEANKRLAEAEQGIKWEAENDR